MPLSVTNIGSNTGVAVSTVVVTVGAGGAPAGAVIVVCVSDNSVSGTGGLNAVADTGGNTYTVAVQANNNNVAANGCGIIYTANVNKALVNTNTITYTLGTATSSAAVSAFYIKGAPTKIEASNSATGSSATPSVTSGTPSVAGDLFVAMVSGTTLIASFTQDSTNAAWASPPGQVSIAAPPLGGGNVVNAGAGTLKYAPAFGTSDTWAALIMGVQGTVSGWEVQSPIIQTSPSTTKQRYTAAKGKSGFAVFPQWRNTGWEPILPSLLKQPPVTNQKAGAILRGDEGIEARKINFFPSGWEFQISHLLPRFYPAARTVPNSGDDGTYKPYVNWKNFGWEIQPPQPPFYQKTNQKTGALSHPEEGIEAKYIFVSQSINWSFDIQQTASKVNYRSGAWSQKEDGIESPFIRFFPAGWEIQSVQPPASPSIRQRYVGTKGKSEFGIYSNWVNFGWEIQSHQPPFYPKTNQKIAALSKWEDGIEAKYIFISPAVNWSFDIQQPPLKVNYRGGSWSQKEDGIEAKFINFFPSGWEVQPLQPQHPTPEKRAAGILRGEDGIEGIYYNWKNFGWEIQSVQPPFYPKTNQKTGALSHPEEGIEFPFIFVPTTFTPWGWELLPLQLRQLTSNRYFGIEGNSEFASFTFQPYGWEIQAFQPSFFPSINRRISAVSQWEDGIEFPFIPPLSVPLNWGFEFQTPWQPPHPTPEKRASGFLRGDDGIEFTFINFKPYGWEIPSPQPPYYPKTNQKISALSHPEDGIEGVYIFVAPGQIPDGWEVQAFQPPFWLRTNQKLGAISQWEDGIEGSFVIWKNAGWEIQPFQPPHVFFEKRGTVLRGIDGIEGKFVNFLPSGWEIQPPQPPFWLKTNLKYGALSHPEEGIEGKYIFVARNVDLNPIGWIIQPWQPPHPRTEKAAAWMFGDLGIEAPFIFVPPKVRNFEWLIRARRRGRR